MSTRFNKREYTLIEHLKKMTIKEAAEEMKITTYQIYQILFRMRNKIEKAQNTVNVAANWMKHKRPAKLLRRQEPPKKEEPQ